MDVSTGNRETPDLGYLSHFPVLAAAVYQGECVGTVVEFGMGVGSSYMLHAMCKAMRLRLISVENSTEYREKFLWMKEDYDLHEIHDCPEKVKTDSIYGAVFIDSSPGEFRKELALRFKGNAMVIICHDAECDSPIGGGNYQYESIYDQFMFKAMYREVRPHTLILSNFYPVERFGCAF